MNPNGEASQDDSMVHKAQADFWKLKYFELLLHSQQVITMLNAPMLQQIRAARMTAQQAAKVGE